MHDLLKRFGATQYSIRLSLLDVCCIFRSFVVRTSLYLLFICCRSYSIVLQSHINFVRFDIILRKYACFSFSFLLLVYRPHTHITFDII